MPRDDDDGRICQTDGWTDGRTKRREERRGPIRIAVVQAPSNIYVSSGGGGQNVKCIGFLRPGSPSRDRDRMHLARRSTDSYYIHLVVHPVWVDLDFWCSAFCTILLGLTTIWQKGLISWARRRNIQIKVNQTELGA